MTTAETKISEVAIAIITETLAEYSGPTAYCAIEDAIALNAWRKYDRKARTMLGFDSIPMAFALSEAAAEFSLNGEAIFDAMEHLSCI